MRLERLFGGPLITPETSTSLGTNIGGPTLIKVPDWVEHKLGKYYLYFSHHIGRYIRMAYSDNLEGPWKIYEPGVLHVEDFPYLDQTEGRGHVASPEIYIDEKEQKIFMYYHGLLPCDNPKVDANTMTTLSRSEWSKKDYDQNTYVAISNDGIHFESTNEIVMDGSYNRILPFRGYLYSFEQFGQVRRSKDGMIFEKGPKIFQRWDQRHLTLLRRENTLYVFHTIRGEAPESIVVSTIDLSPDWMQWKESDYQVLLKPELDYEGADCPLEKSVVGASRGRENALRDPYIYEEAGHIYMFYAIAGESGIAAAELFL